MSNLLYLLVAAAGSIIGSLVLWLRHRKPRSVKSGIEEFQRGLEALAPNAPPGPRAGRRQRQRVL